MEIREIREDELDQLLEFYLLHLFDVKDEPLADKKKVDQVWNNIQTSKNFAVLGVFDKNKLMASCSISIVPNLTRGCRSYALIENIATHRQFRREGYGSGCMLYAVEYAKRCGCYKIMFMTGHMNEKVEKFCAVNGFKSKEKQAYIKRWE